MGSNLTTRTNRVFHFGRFGGTPFLAATHWSYCNFRMRVRPFEYQPGLRFPHGHLLTPYGRTNVQVPRMPPVGSVLANYFRYPSAWTAPVPSDLQRSKAAAIAIWPALIALSPFMILTELIDFRLDWPHLNPASVAAAASLFVLGAERVEERLELRWSSSAIALTGGERAQVAIADGGRLTSIPLDAAALAGGRYTYEPVSGLVMFTIEAIGVEKRILACLMVIDPSLDVAGISESSSTGLGAIGEQVSRNPHISKRNRLPTTQDRRKQPITKQKHKATPSLPRRGPRALKAFARPVSHQALAPAPPASFTAPNTRQFAESNATTHPGLIRRTDSDVSETLRVAVEAVDTVPAGDVRLPGIGYDRRRGRFAEVRSLCQRAAHFWRSRFESAGKTPKVAARVELFPAARSGLR